MIQEEALRAKASADVLELFEVPRGIQSEPAVHFRAHAGQIEVRDAPRSGKIVSTRIAELYVSGGASAPLVR